jgi:CheY-like chemotaxis protein
MMEHTAMTTPHPSVLIVDDEAGLRRSLHFGLAQRGFVTEEVEEALPALRLIESRFQEGRPFQFVVADINLPDINGLKLLEMIKSKYPALPVIVISAYGTEDTGDSVSVKHGDAYLGKPFMVDELAEVMHRIPERHVEPVEVPGAAVQKASVSAYVMVTVRPDADVTGLFRELYYMDDVVYCDAVHDQYDVVLLVNGASTGEVEQVVRRIEALPGVASAAVQPIVAPVIEPAIAEFIKDYEHHIRREHYHARLAGTAVSAYLFVEVEKGRFAEVFPKLYFMNGVVSCDATRGQYDAVALIQSPNFKGIERILNEDVRMIDGIVRARSVKIITMYEM